MLRGLTFVAALTLMGAAACGGPSAPTKEPVSVSRPTAAAPVPPPSEPAPAAPIASAAPAASALVPPEAPPEPEPVTPIADRIVASSIAFMIRYDDSAPKQAAIAACAKAGDDPEARATCMEKERGRFVADVLRFHKDDKGTSLTIYRRQGNALQEISRSAVDFGEQTPARATLKVKSDKGTRPLFAGKREITVSASADSTSNIELDDPRFGKLIYEARVGLLND
jgi:hypothetical protein